MAVKWSYEVGAVTEIDDQGKQVCYFVSYWPATKGGSGNRKRHAGSLDVPLSADAETEVLNALLGCGFEQSHLVLE